MQTTYLKCAVIKKDIHFAQSLIVRVCTYLLRWFANKHTALYVNVCNLVPYCPRFQNVFQPFKHWAQSNVFKSCLDLKGQTVIIILHTVIC